MLGPGAALGQAKKLSYEEAMSIALNEGWEKLGVAVTPGDEREQCSGALEILKQKLRTDGKASPEADADRLFKMIQANPPRELAEIWKGSYQRAGTDAIANLVTCIAQVRFLKSQVVGSVSSVSPFRRRPGEAVSGGGNVKRLSETHWRMIRDEDKGAFDRYIDTRIAQLRK
jgi:hypothetical protein